MEKVGNAKVKANLQLPFYIREIDFKYLKGYCLSAKKDKKDANWEHCNKAFSKDKKKVKSYNPFFANWS